MKKFAFFALAVILALIVIGGATAQTKIPGSRIQDGAIDSVHLSSDLVALLAFHAPGNDTAVKYALVALDVQSGSLTLLDFNTASRDSLKHGFVRWADSAGVVTSLSKEALNDTLQIIASLRDGIFGRGATPWVYKARRAGQADSSLKADYADEAGIADSARTAPRSDSSAWAAKAGLAEVALVAISSDTTVGDSTVSWASFVATLKSAILTDSVQRAKRADSLSANSIDSYGMFDATMKSTYIPTANEKGALRSTGTPSSSNPYVDSTYARAYYPFNLDGADRPIRIDVTGSRALVAGDVIGINIDTLTGAISIDDMNNTRFVLIDSTLIRSWLTTDSADYVGRESSSGAPAKLYNENGTPGAGVGSVGDWAIDTSTVALWVKTGAATWELVSAGGASSDSAIYIVPTSGASVHVDSVLLTTRSRTIDGSGGALYIGDGSHANILAIRGGADFLSYGQVKVDSFMANPPDDGYTGYQIIVVGTDTIVGPITIGRSGDVNNQPYGYFRNMTVSGQLVINSASDVTLGNILPYNSTVTVGGASSPYKWDAVNAADVYIANQGSDTPSLTVVDTITSDQFSVTTGTGLSVALTGTPLTVTGGDITVTGGSITAPTITATNGPSMGVNGLALSVGDGISLPTTATIQMASGAEMLVPSDTSNSFADMATGSEQYFLLLDDEKQGLRGACPDPSSTNHVITMSRLKQVLNELLTPIDTVATRRSTARKYTYSPGCNDTITWGSANQAIFWPRMKPLPHPAGWGDNEQLIEPWQWPIVPGIPSPINVDSASGAMSYFDPYIGIAEHTFKVSSRFDPRFGYLTGNYQTIKQACDSLPSFRVRLDSCIQSLSSGNTVAVRITPQSAFGGNQVRCYRGEKLVEDSIRANLPDHITQIGTFVKFRRSGDEEGRWCKTVRWDNDTLFYVQDSVLYNYFNAFAGPDSSWDLTFAVKKTIQILPPVDGGMIILDTTVTINDECPVRLEGTGKTEVVITNKDGSTTTPDFSTMFDTKYFAGYDTCYTGMPIEFANMSILYDSVTNANSPVFHLSGDVLFQDMNIVARLYPGTNKGVIQHEYFDGQYVRGNTPGIIMENVTCALDTDGVVVGLLSDSTTFQSYNSVYSVGGDSGRVLLYHTNVWPVAGTQCPPQFFGDQFYFYGATVGKLAGTWAAQAWDSVSVVQSHFVGLDGVTSDGSGALAGDWNNIIPNGNNSYSSVMTQPPGKIKELPVEVPYIPKK